MFQDSQSWAERVFSSCSLSDIRLKRRLIRTAAKLAENPEASVNAACQGDHALQEGAYRLLENDHVSAAAIAGGGYGATVSAGGSQEGDLILAMDTTSLTFSHGVRDQLGPVGPSAQQGLRGWLVHSSLMLSAQDGCTLGLLDQEWWQRDPSQHGKKRRRKCRAYQQKESYKWESSLSRCAARLGQQMSRVITVADREADIYEFLSYHQRQGYRYVVRASYDRVLSAVDSKLFDHLRSQAALGQTQITVQQRGGRTARTATVTLRSARVTLFPPSSKKQNEVPLTLWALQIVEESPPAGVSPLVWRLLTTEAVTPLEEALKVQGYYALRWRVEEFHKAWKSGCGLHETRMQYADNLQRLAQILAFIGIRLLQIKEAQGTESSCESRLKPEEWKLLWWSTMPSQPLPSTPPDLQWAYYTLAKLGGWIDTKRQRRVGWRALWKGYNILQERWMGWKLAKEKCE